MQIEPKHQMTCRPGEKVTTMVVNHFQITLASSLAAAATPVFNAVEEM